MSLNSRIGFDIRPSQYIFGLQAVPLVASGIYTLLWPEIAANYTGSPLQGLDPGTIQAMR
ncbi:uncharacterized protein N7483_001714 [Penicillium malachiteum]|uniref:uncharacterized protein n=1 Tax=Penicillium malachiteum TaxID=1324776 RepID=UPI0025486BD6|nr:uncharacterized protein N7483_001714 [Penicillium malachiteum]KAJ5736589.1 hypothetical protein N7483_001714 [Penicillium malachiteum]